MYFIHIQAQVDMYVSGSNLITKSKNLCTLHT